MMAKTTYDPAQTQKLEDQAKAALILSWDYVQSQMRKDHKEDDFNVSSKKHNESGPCVCDLRRMTFEYAATKSNGINGEALAYIERVERGKVKEEIYSTSYGSTDNLSDSARLLLAEATKGKKLAGLEILNRKAAELNHAPNQEEMYWAEQQLGKADIVPAEVGNYVVKLQAQQPTEYTVTVRNAKSRDAAIEAAFKKVKANPGDGRPIEDWEPTQEGLVVTYCKTEDEYDNEQEVEMDY